MLVRVIFLPAYNYSDKAEINVIKSVVVFFSSCHYFNMTRWFIYEKTIFQVNSKQRTGVGIWIRELDLLISKIFMIYDKHDAIEVSKQPSENISEWLKLECEFEIYMYLAALKITSCMVYGWYGSPRHHKPTGNW